MMSLRTARTLAWTMLAIALALVLILPTSRAAKIVAGVLALFSAVLFGLANMSDR